MSWDRKRVSQGPEAVRNALNFNGAGLMLAGMAIIGLIDNYVVEIAKDAGLWQFHLIRALFAIPMLIGAGLLLKQALLPKRWWAVALRSFCLAAAMLLYFGSIPSMPIALVVAGLFTSPVFVLIFSVLGLGMRIGVYRIIAVFLGFSGVSLILSPWSADVSWQVLMPVAGGALYALNAIAARRLCAEESTIAMLIGFFGMLGLMGLVGLLVLGNSTSAEFILRGWTAPTNAFLWWTLLQAVGSIIAVGFLTRAYQTSETTYLVVFEYSLLIFASFWAFLLYGQTVGPMAIFGMGLIVVSGVLIASRGEGEVQVAPASPKG